MTSVMIRFEYGQEDRLSEDFGPFPFAQLTYESVRVGEDGDEWLAQYADGLWHCERDGKTYSDIVIYSPSPSRGNEPTPRTIQDADIEHAATLDDLDAAALHLQKIAGITDGGIAGTCLNVEKWATAGPDRVGMLSRWLQVESNMEPEPALRPGARVRLTDAVDNFPTCLIPAGETGTVTHCTDGFTMVRLDKHHPELAEWQNQLEVWHRSKLPLAPLSDQ